MTSTINLHHTAKMAKKFKSFPGNSQCQTFGCACKVK